MLVEVCANSLESALVAERAGAHRIELCAELAVGGITPSYGLLKSVLDKVSLPVHVLIRPRSGDFTYSDAELDSMLEDIACCLDLGAAGIVSGILYKDFSLDVKRTGRLINATKNLKFTFHRAFDWIRDPLNALTELENLGVDTILTSGQQSSAEEGISLLKELKKKASSLEIMPGSGINSANALLFKEAGFGAIHLSGTRMIKQLDVQPRVEMNSYRLLSDDHVPITQYDTINGVVNKVK